jgi:hypothetical protein
MQRATWPLSDDDIEWMENASPVERYVYFVERASWWELVWVLSSTHGHAETFDAAGLGRLAVWPHEYFATRCISKWCPGLVPERITTRRFFTSYVRRAAGLKGKFEVFPVPGESGRIVEGQDLYSDYRDWPHLRTRMLGIDLDLPEAPERDEHRARHAEQECLLRRSADPVPRRRAPSGRRPWDLEGQELDAAVREPAWARYVYFIQRISWWGPVWVLATDDGYMQSTDSQGNCYLSVWPHPAYAERCARLWPLPCRPESMATRFFVSDLLKRGDVGALRYEIFPTSRERGYLSVASELLRDFLAEQSGSCSAWAQSGCWIDL